MSLNKDYKYDFLRLFGIGFCIYLFMLTHLWWGNHDWGYLKSGVGIESGLFEGRYSQHLITISLIDGHVLPVLTLMISLFFLIISGFLIAKYLKIGRFGRFIISLFLILNPYVFVIFYYMYLSLPFTFWHVWTVGLLFLAEPKFSIRKLILGGFGYGVLMGGYMPVLGLSAVLFCGKMVIDTIKKKMSFREYAAKVLMYGTQIFIGFTVFEIFYKIIENSGKINTDMYNLKLRGPIELIKNFGYSFYDGILQFGKATCYMGAAYCVLMLLLVGCGIWVALYRGRKNKFWIFVWLCGIIVSSRLLFIVADGAWIASFRLAYWGKTGVCMVMFALISDYQKLWQKNLLFCGVVCMFSLFVMINLQIQKDWIFGFDGNRKNQTRLLERLYENEKFDINNAYIDFVFGEYNFSEKYRRDKSVCSDEMCNKHSFTFDLIKNLFWETDDSPVVVNNMWMKDRILKIFKNDAHKIPDFQDNPENISAIRFWTYMQANVYPAHKFLYIDDKYIIMVLNKEMFYHNREQVIKNLDK